MAAWRDYLAFVAANADDTRLEFYDEYPIPTTCPPTFDGRPRVRNPDGQHRCRIISKLRDNANGYELLHNKIKKWIKRKSIITRLIMENIRKKFPRMNDKDHQKIFKEFLMVSEGGNEEKAIKKREEFYNKINSNESAIGLSSKESLKEFFEVHYTQENLINSKSQGIECSRDDVNRINKIKSLHSDRCIIAYKDINPNRLRKTGFENYADYLFNNLKNLFPKKIYFNREEGDTLMELYTEFFPD